MGEKLTALTDALHQYGVTHDAGKPDRLDRLRNLEPDSAALLALLVRATHTQHLLELGTSNGYSTLWLADAVRGFSWLRPGGPLSYSAFAEEVIAMLDHGLAT